MTPGWLSQALFTSSPTPVTSSFGAAIPVCLSSGPERTVLPDTGRSLPGAAEPGHGPPRLFESSFSDAAPVWLLMRWRHFLCAAVSGECNSFGVPPRPISPLRCAAELCPPGSRTASPWFHHSYGALRCLPFAFFFTGFSWPGVMGLVVAPAHVGMRHLFFF